MVVRVISPEVSTIKVTPGSTTLNVTIASPEVKPIKIGSESLTVNATINEALTISEDLPYDLGSNSYGELSGSGTYIVPEGGISIIDFIKDVLITALPVNAAISATPTPIAYNLASTTSTVTPTFSSGNAGVTSTATVTRILNGVETEISADAASGVAITDTVTLNTLPGSSAVNTLSYRVDVTDANGSTGNATAVVAQTAYAEPTVSNFNILRVTNSISSDETNLFREKGNSQSNVNFIANRNSPEVDMTSVVLFRGVPLAPNLLDTETPISGANLHSFSYSDTTAPNFDYYYSVQIGDGHPNSPSDFTSSTVDMDGDPFIFTAYNQEYTSSSSDSDIQNIIDNFNSSNGYYKLRSNQSDYLLTSTPNMNASGYWSYIIYNAGLGSLNDIKQGGSTATSILSDHTDLGTFTVTNQFNQSLSVRIYRSNFDQPYNNQQIFIQF